MKQNRQKSLIQPIIKENSKASKATEISIPDMSRKNKLKCNSRDGKYVKAMVIADNGSNKGSNLDYDKHTLKATEISIPNESEKLELKNISVPEKNMKIYFEAAVEKEGTKKVQNNDCQNTAIFTNEQAGNNPLAVMIPLQQH